MSTNPMLPILHAYLTRKAQTVYPDAVVLAYGEDTEAERWTMERTEGQSIEIGKTFQAARSALLSILSAEEARRRKPASTS